MSSFRSLGQLLQAQWNGSRTEHEKPGASCTWSDLPTDRRYDFHRNDPEPWDGAFRRQHTVVVVVRIKQLSFSSQDSSNRLVSPAVVLHFFAFLRPGRPLFSFLQ